MHPQLSDYYDLGTYSRPVTTTSREAQLWFNRGLLWRYGFNTEEAVRCFRKAIEHDDRCAMAYWGVSYAYGPRYNKPWEAFEEKELLDALRDARRSIEAALARLDGAASVEQALIRALERRYQSDRRVSNDELRTWVDAYAQSMREVYAAFRSSLPSRFGLGPHAESSEATPGQCLESARIRGMSAATRPARRAHVGAIAPRFGSGSSGCENRRVVFLPRGT